MKRRVLMLALFLVLFLVGGAIVNVAVAWGCVSVDARSGNSESTTVGSWYVQIHQRPGALHLWSTLSSTMFEGSQVTRDADFASRIPSWSRVQRSNPEHEYVDAYGQFEDEDARGWPALSMRSSLDAGSFRMKKAAARGRLPQNVSLDGDSLSVLNEDGTTRRVALAEGDCVESGILLWANADLTEFRILPLRPIWGGFAINTVFYAAVLWGLFALGGTPFALRKRLRIKRGLCPKCAYPVGTNQVCTECGAAVKGRPVRGDGM